MQVLIMYAYHGVDLQFVMAAQIEGTLSMISPVITLEGQAHRCKCNPLLVYGDYVAKFTGHDKYDISYNVFGCIKGNLKGWAT